MTTPATTAATHSDLLTVEIQAPIAILTLNRPQKRNALSLRVVLALKTAFETLPDTVRVVVLAGTGTHFCAGLDLSELSDTTTAEGIRHSFHWYESFSKIQFGRFPVVCAMQGAVVGGGLELASSAHVRVADDTTYFGLPEGQRGIFLGGGGSVRISKLIGFSRVTEMMLTGHVLNAQEGHAVGLAHYVTPAGQALEKALELARRIAGNAPLSNYAITHVLPHIAEQSMANGLMTEALIAAITQGEPEAKARVNAFLEKRAAKVTPQPPLTARTSDKG